MTSNLRIGLFTPAWPGHATPNGIATSVYNLAMGLREIGLTPVILPMAVDGDGPADIPVVPVPEVPWKLMERVRIRLGDFGAPESHLTRRMAAAVDTAAQDHGLDVVIMEESLGRSQRVQSLTGIPVVLTLHGPSGLLRRHLRPNEVSTKYERYKEDRERDAFLVAPALISPSAHVLEGVKSLAPVPDSTPRIVLPNSYAAPHPDPLAASLEARDILFIGRFDYLKGGDTVLAAMTRLIETHPTARLTFAGPDRGLAEEDGRVVKVAEALNRLPDAVQAQITYLGPASRGQVAELRADHAIALIASRYENLNYSLLEAMAAGQAIVSTAVGGPSEVLEDGKTALMVPPADADAMAAALGRLLDDAALTQGLGQAALSTLQADYNPGHVAAQTVEFLRTALDLT